MEFKLNTIIFFLFNCFVNVLSEKVTYDTTCTLTEAAPSNPFPDLSKCYNFNEASCCTVVHDTAIADFIASFIPEACIRKYPEFEELFCFPCSPYESVYYDADNEKLKVCKTFAFKIWNVTSEEGLLEPTTRFDNCGFMLADEQEDIKNANGNLTEYLPSKTKLNFYQFIKALNFPLYPLSEIELVDSEDESICFIGAYSIKISKVILLLLFMFYLC